MYVKMQISCIFSVQFIQFQNATSSPKYHNIYYCNCNCKTYWQPSIMLCASNAVNYTDRNDRRTAQFLFTNTLLQTTNKPTNEQTNYHSQRVMRNAHMRSVHIFALLEQLRAATHVAR